MQNIEGWAAKHLRYKGEKAMKIKEADVAELVDARDLKSVGPLDFVEVGCKTQPRQTRETGENPADLQNIIPGPQRIQRKRTKGWKMPPNTVYVGRPGPWGNPFRACLPIDAVRSYRRWLRGDADLRSVGQPPIREEIQHLAGKDLACWCRLDQPCHADVLLELAKP